MSLYGAITRKDLKNDKLLWIFVVILIPPLGPLIYFFVEGKKGLGILWIIAGLLMVLLPVLSLGLVSRSAALEKIERIKAEQQNTANTGVSQGQE